MLNKRGFTLIELLLVIAIAAGIFIFSAPFAVRFYQAQLVSEAQSNIINILEEARHNAVLQKNDSAFGVKIDGITHKIILFQGQSYAEKVSGSEESSDLLPDIFISGPGEFTFAKMTGISSATGTIVLTYGSITKEILINDSNTISKTN
jgi:prepilin-type N-terminal cleavage/methylation domain-containing protein